MCKVHNVIGSLTAIKSHLHSNNVKEFNSVKELITFQKNYSNFQKKIISDHSILIKSESNRLEAEIPELERIVEINTCQAEQELQLKLNQLKAQLNKLQLIELNILKRIIFYFQKLKITGEIRNIENNYQYRIAQSTNEYTDKLSVKTTRYKYIISNFSNAVDESSYLQLRELERKKKIIDEVNNLIYGAIGEQKVSSELEKLPDECVLINDFTCFFNPPIFNKKENDYIKSVQIDHILISHSGVFLIETKNWSENSLNNLSLRSPVEQIKRTNFALFKILNERIASNMLARHHWGERKIPIKNLIVLIDRKPNEEFKYVKILTLKELRSYIEYLSPCISQIETNLIANYLLKINKSNNH